MKLRVHFRLACRRSIVLLAGTASAMAEVDGFYHFDDPVGLDYGHEVLAPMKGGVRVVDWNRDGSDDLIVAGRRWIRDGEADGMSIYKRGEPRVRIPGPALVDLNGDGREDTVEIRDGRFIWHQAKVAGSMEQGFEEVGPLPFTEGGDLRLADSTPATTWILQDISDVDSDGRHDLLASRLTNEQLDGDSAYAPYAFAGFGRGWRDGRWVFHDYEQSLWWFRNTGPPDAPRFSMAQLVLHGEAGLSIGSNVQALSARAMDWDGDGINDLFLHTDNRSIIFPGRKPGTPGGVLFGDGRLLRYGDRTETDERKSAAVMRDENGLLRIFYSGGAVVREAVQISPDNPYEFTKPQWVLFRNPSNRELDIFVVPNVADWNGDGRKDIIAGSEAGYLWYFENLDPQGGIKSWAAPRLLEADGKAIRLFRAENLQGPQELLIGYANPKVVDWNLDGKLDIVCGYHAETLVWFENIGTPAAPQLTARGPLVVTSDDGLTSPISVAWRQRPAVGDATGDGLPDIMAADGNGMLTLWRRHRDHDGNLRLGLPEHPLDMAGHPFQMTPHSRGSGRAKSILVDWDRDGLPDLVTSPPTSLGARTEFIYYYKNLGEHDGVLRVEFRPREIKVSGQVEAGNFTHYRMLEPVDWHDDGTWQGIAGTDCRHPGIPNTWFYFWNNHKLVDRVPLPSPSAKHPSPGIFRSMPMRDLPAVETWGQPWDGWLDQPRATLFRHDGAEVRTAEAGGRVFGNRDHTFNTLPPELTGLGHIPGDIEGETYLCGGDGMVLLLVPYLDGPFRNYFVEQAALHGFRRTSIPDFTLFGEDPRNTVAVMAARFKKGNVLVIGHWGVPLFQR